MLINHISTIYHVTQRPWLLILRAGLLHVSYSIEFAGAGVHAISDDYE